jgi:hypothetical protein
VRAESPCYLQSCTVPDCDRSIGRHGGRGWCAKHYLRYWVTGSPTGTARPTPVSRFEKFLSTDGDCWIWQGTRDGSGYGMFSDRTRNLWISRAHRWSYEFHVAEIPDGLELDHLCRNRACVNPWHLEPVTGLINIKRGAESRWTGVCRNGHEYTEANTYIAPSTSRRVCRACAAATRKRYEQRKAR